MGRLEVQVPERSWHWQQGDEELLMWVEENTTKGETLTVEKAVGGIQNVHHESIAGKYDGIEGMSGELYSYLVAATTDEALGVVKAVESGDGIETWAELHTKYNQRTMTRMMRVLAECMYPKEVRVAELGAAILQWEGKWNKNGRTAERNKYPADVDNGGINSDVSKRIKKR